MSQLGDEQFHLQILNALPNAIIAVDGQQRITFWNQFAAETFGWQPAEIAGKSIRAILPEQALGDAQLAILLAVPRDSAEAHKLSFRGKNGVLITGYVTANSAGGAGENGGGTTVYVIAHDSAHPTYDGDVFDLLASVDETTAGGTLLLRQVLDTLPFGVSVANRSGQIVLSNPAEQQIWGMSPARAGGTGARSFFDVRAGQRVPPEAVALMQAIQNGDVTLQETLEIVSHDGEHKTIFSSAAPIRNHRAEIIGGIVVHQDVTEQLRIEQAERKQRTFANALSNITATLTSSLNLPTVMERILDNVGRVVPHEAVNIMLIEDDAIRVAFWRNYGPRCDEIFRSKRYPLDMMVVHEMLTTGLPQLISDTRNSAVWVSFPETAWIRSTVGVPIRARSEIIGFLFLDSSVPEFFTPPDAERLRAFAYQAAIAIENARLFSTVQAYATELESRVIDRTAELRAAKDHVEAILEQSSDGFALVDEQGAISQVNPAFRQLFGIGELQADSPTLFALVHPNGRERLALALREALVNRKSRRLDLECVRRDGTPFDADAAIAPLFDAAQNRHFFICNVRDITRQKTAERELRSALEREKQLNDLKSQFVAMVSHEFRTPLAVIQMSSDILNRYHDRITDQRRSELILRIQSQVSWLTGMLEDVLTIANADTFGLELELETVDLNALCVDLILDINEADGKRYAILVHPLPEPLPVELDSLLMQHALRDIVSNAMKYSAESSQIDVEIRATERDAIIEIRDQGIGIQEAELKAVFEPFYRAQNVGGRPGTGLGLTVVMRAVQAHHGTITVESELGVGTRFVITLPKQQPPP